MAKLTELLVSSLIIGTVYLIQPIHTITGKAIQIEAKLIIGTINMLQQPFLIENQRFASTLKELGLGIPSETKNYEYKVFALEQTQAQVTARAKQLGAKSYTSAVFVVKDNVFGNSIAVAVCESEQPSQKPPSMLQVPQSRGYKIKCPSGSKQLSW